jgi:hypothetical protein
MVLERIKIVTKMMTKPRLKIRLNSGQLQTYEFCILLLVKATEPQRDIIQLRNFPYRKSFRELRKFFLPSSHEKVRSDYYKALLDLSMVYNTKGYKYISK